MRGRSLGGRCRPFWFVFFAVFWFCLRSGFLNWEVFGKMDVELNQRRLLNGGVGWLKVKLMMRKSCAVVR